MSFKDQMAQDLAIVFNEDEFGESITYNGNAIVAIIDRQEQPMYNGNNVANFANVLVKKSDVPNVAYQDTVQFDDSVWTVVNFKNLDGHTIILSVKRNEGYAFKE